MSSTNACGSSKRVPGSSPAILRNSLSPWTRPSIHPPKPPGLLARLRFPLWPRRALLCVRLEVCLFGVELVQVTAREDIATVARQLAELTQTVGEMAGQLKEVRERAENERERTDVQQERIDLAARELSDVSDRLQAAANALRESI